jgi:hypothetical protein
MERTTLAMAPNHVCPPALLRTGVLFFFDQLFVTRHARFFLTPDLSVSDQTRFIARGWPRVNPGLMKSWSKKNSIRGDS